MTEENIVDYINFSDIINVNPGSEPYVPLYSHVSYSLVDDSFISDFDLISHRSVIVDANLKEKALKEIEYENIFLNDDGCVGVPYTIGEQDDLLIEPLWFYRYWSGLEINSYEPSQKLIHVLKLQNDPEKSTEWIDPYTKEIVVRVIVKEESFENGYKQNKEIIEIKLDYLKAFLLKNKSGLIIVRYARRTPVFSESKEIPLDIPHKQEIKNCGTVTWNHSLNNDVLSGLSPQGKELGQAELNQKFWVDPAKPKKSGCRFTLHDGSVEEYQDSHNDYFKFISFNSNLLDLFYNKLHYDFLENSRETLNLCFPDGTSLLVGINDSSQLQALWGNIVKIPLCYQTELSPYSETCRKKIRPNHEYVQITHHGLWNCTDPISASLQKLKLSINEYFVEKCGKSYFSNALLENAKVFYFPYTNTKEQLFKIMKGIDTWLLEAKLPKELNKYFSLPNNDQDKYFNSLKSLKLLLNKYDYDENKIEVISVIRDFRHCDAHPEKDFNEIINKFGFAGFSPIEIYKKVIVDLEHSLQWFLFLCSENKFKTSFNQ